MVEVVLGRDVLHTVANAPNARTLNELQYLGLALLAKRELLDIAHEDDFP